MIIFVNPMWSVQTINSDSNDFMPPIELCSSTHNIFLNFFRSYKIFLSKGLIVFMFISLMLTFDFKSTTDFLISPKIDP